MIFILCTGLFLLISFVRAQSSASAYVQPTVPTGRPVTGDYSGALRPQIHYSPPAGFMVGLFLLAVSFQLAILSL